VNKKRILVIDDDEFVVKNLSMILKVQGYEVDAAGTGKEALEKSNLNTYDLALVDFRLPDIEGTKLLTAFRETRPRMVKIMLTGYPSTENKADALERNADAFLLKPVKIDALLHTIKEHLFEQSRNVEKNDGLIRNLSKDFVIVAVGASAGGPKALERVLSRMPSSLPAAFVISQHMPDGFTKQLAQRLNEVSHLRVKEASSADVLHEGDVLVAPGGFNMEIATGGRIRLLRTSESPSPSIDAMMESVAESYGSRAVGVLLTGMLTDGVKGMRAIKDKGGTTIVQDENSSVVYGMPKAALEAGVADIVADIFEIPNRIANTIARMTHEECAN
jgi:two-component system chemotaxis response regulator CheB